MNEQLGIMLAQAGGQGGGGGLSTLLIMGALFALFYAFLIRPQQKRDQELREMRESVKKGDRIVTTGGLHGRVTGVADDVLTLEIADRVRVKVERTSVVRHVGEEKAS